MLYVDLYFRDYPFTTCNLYNTLVSNAIHRQTIQ